MAKEKELNEDTTLKLSIKTLGGIDLLKLALNSTATIPSGKSWLKADNDINKNVISKFFITLS